MLRRRAGPRVTLLKEGEGHSENRAAEGRVQRQMHLEATSHLESPEKTQRGGTGSAPLELQAALRSSSPCPALLPPQIPQKSTFILCQSLSSLA